MPAPAVGRAGRRPRLDTIRQDAPAPTPKAVSPPPHVAAAAHTKPCCEAPEFDPYEPSPRPCLHCGKPDREEGMQFQNELQFGETSSGAAMVVGGFVAEDQRHANTMGGNMRGLGGMESREKTLLRGKDEIARLVAALRLRQVVNDQAVRLYRIALNHNFVQGRRIRNVAACCIYLADRKQPESTLFLMDLAEKIRVNVWTLGDTYKQFLAITYNEDPASEQGGLSKLPELEPLVLKYCRRLEFDSDSYRVAEDACRLIKRMSRDWMVTGRQPAGIIGAAIILAARMNNFRRTVREVVYCVKVADSTIHHRLHEFRRTKAAVLSVKQMREIGLRLKDDIQPPAIYKREEKEARKRKRALLALAAENVTEDGEVVESPAATKRRRTAKGPVPTPSDDGSESITNTAGADPHSDSHLDFIAATVAEATQEDAEEEVAPLPKKRGRPPKRKAPIVIPQEDLDIEADIEDEVVDNLREWQNVFKEFNTNEEHPVLKAAGDRALAMVREHMPDNNIRLTEEVDEEEFLDDEDVQNCLCTPEEAAIKEKIWITENEDWLREQQAKLMAQELEKANGKTKKPKRQRKRAMMGDGSVLEGRPASSAAEAAKKMIDKRAKFSHSIDYAVLENFLQKTGEISEDGAGASTDSVVPAQNTAATTALPAGEAEVVEEIEDYEDYDEPAQDYDDYDSNNNNMYMSDEDVGFEEYDDNF